MKYQDIYQFFVILLVCVVLVGFGLFFYREISPDYKVYQKTYKDLETFRSSYTHEAPAAFATGIKQILIPDPKNGPEVVDRCISCHVSLDLPHFSPTRIAHDVNANVVLDHKGNPVLEENPDYIWKKLEEKVAELKNPEVISALQSQGKNKEAEKRQGLALSLESLKIKTIEGKPVDMTKALRMHPLIGSETRPFEFHSQDTFGCTSCHSGNGRALVAERAHGPVYDGQYEVAYHTKKPQFTEKDPENDPKFAYMYNDKPGHELIFQTTPLLAGPLIAAKCVQCHASAQSEVKEALNKFVHFADQQKEVITLVNEGLSHEKEALISLLSLHLLIREKGYDKTIEFLDEKLADFHLTDGEIDTFEAQRAYLKNNEEVESALFRDILKLTGSEDLTVKLIGEAHEERDLKSYVEDFLEKEKCLSIETKKEALEKSQKAMTRLESALDPLKNLTKKSEWIQNMQGDVDVLLLSYSKGKDLFLSQACYACHRISGFSRASVGPELTKAGLSYPWYVKESIVWPQADLPSSTMPNFRLDHEEVGNLMTFLMAQTGNTKSVSEMDYQISTKEWEGGKKMPWEMAISPVKLQDVKEGMLVFAHEGCAACHKLQGFYSESGFTIEKKPDVKPAQIIEERAWFRKLFPEQIMGYQLVELVEKHAKEIEAHLSTEVRKEGILEEIEQKFPGLIEGFYSNFKFAARAKNAEYQNDPEKLAGYQKRLHLVLMAYIQEYGLGRDIAPHLNWSGVYRNNAWLLGHFHNPPAYTARSIMPVVPFDDTKFYMLSNMLHVLGQQNRERLKQLWKIEGFSPPLAYEMLCSQCHGEYRQGNGLVAEWIYPVPKNLRNPVFLKNLTKEKTIESITHGVNGTPMPPWGEVISKSELGDELPVLSGFEIMELTNWLYQGIPDDIRADEKDHTLKWHYTPRDVVEEMKKEKSFLAPTPSFTDHDFDELAAEYFEERPHPNQGIDKTSYYIKEKYYTQTNLDQGAAFFQTNCAICHGKEGTGAGLRATSMLEAKPRMLTNVPWIRTRDDLRLLRSIKYGVAGTSMVPWGDQTSSLQRMQLVMFIRSLSRSQVLRDSLEEALYDIFDYAGETIEIARKTEYEMLQLDQNRVWDIEDKLFNLTHEESASSDDIAKLYLEKTNLERDLEKKMRKDSLFKDLIHLVDSERKIYKTIGEQFISPEIPIIFTEHCLCITRNTPLLYAAPNGKLILEISKEKEKTAEQFLSLLENEIQNKINEYERQVEAEKKKMDHPEKENDLQKIRAQQRTFINLKTKLFVQMAEAKKNRERQLDIYERIYGKNSST